MERQQMVGLELVRQSMVDSGLGLSRRADSLWRRHGPALGTVALIGLLVALAAALTPGVLARSGVHTDGVVLTWWELAPAFALAALLVVHVQFDGEAHTFSLSELPFVLALLFASPQDLILARLVGEAITLVLIERQPGVKLTFNLTLFWAEGCVALVTFQSFGGTAGELDAGTWWAAVAAVGMASALAAAAVWTVIRCHGGNADPRPLLIVAAVTALCNASLAGVTAVLITDNRWALVPLLVVIAVVVAAYRGYNRLSKRYAGLEALYTFTKATGEVTSHERAVSSVLESARHLLRAGSAAITLSPAEQGGEWVRASAPVVRGAMQPTDRLWEQVRCERRAVVLPPDTTDPVLREALDLLGVRDGVVAPLLNGDVVTGTLLLANRLGDVGGSFDTEDARLLTALAAQAGVALEKGRLIQQLHDQATAREHEAMHDALTGLPNRSLFARELDRTLETAAREGSRTGVLLMDLDQFKEVNDTLGHHTGDLLLREVAGRLSDTVRDRGMVARLGGDEFAVLLPRLESPAEAVRLSGQLRTRMTEPIRLASLRLEVGASIGVAVRPEHGSDGEVLLQRADVAMYAAKRSRERVALYDPRTDWSSPLRLRLAADLRAALADRQLAVRYQPIAQVEDLDVVTVEALARWPHPELGDLSPEEFIPIAERTGLIGPLTRYVLERSLEQWLAWRSAGLDIRVAVNLSVQNLLDGEWPATVLDLLRRHGVPPNRLTFEITETGIMSDPASMIPLLNELAGAGVQFSIDDFGTGHSSLSYLQRLPVSEVKIDKSFVLPMTTDPNAASIVRSVVDLARNLRLRTIAEGVENQETVDQLARMRCDWMQGYFLSEPQPGPELTRWLAARRH